MTIQNTWKRSVPYLIQFQGLIVLALLIIVCWQISPERRDGTNVFMSSRNLLNIVRFSAENGIIAIGMTLVIITGGIDLSVGSLLALCSVGTAWMMMTQDQPLIPTLLVVLAVGIIGGTVNGLVTTKLKIQSFITTLATRSVARGLASLWVGGYAVPMAFGKGDGLAPESYKRIFAEPVHMFGQDVPVQIFYFVAIALLFSFILNFTKFGRYIYAVGGNDVAARNSGIPVDFIRTIVFAITGFLVAIAAFLHVGLVNQGSHIDGENYELNAIAAVVIGGTSLFGGVGTIGGTVIGALILQILDNILGLRNTQSEYQLILKGVIIVLAVVLQRARR